MDNNGTKKQEAKKAEGGTSGWKQWGVLAVVIGIIAIGGYMLGNGTVKAPADSAEDDAASETALQGTNEVTTTYAWEFTPAGGDGTTGAPFTKVALISGGESKDLGTFTGSCSIVGETDTWTLQPNQLTGTICSWDGDGVELGLFLEGGAVVLKKGTLTEGAEGEASVRGNYEVVETL